MFKPTGDRNDAAPSDLQPTHAEILAARRAEAEWAAAIDRAFEAGELSREAYKVALAAVGATKLPAGYTLGPCPTWCRTDHAERDAHESTDGLREHSSEPVFISAANSDATGKAAHVTVCVMDDLEAGVRHPAAVIVSSDDELIPTNARLLAAAITGAAELAEAWNRCVSA
jgi:hypothetical protein